MSKLTPQDLTPGALIWLRKNYNGEIWEIKEQTPEGFWVITEIDSRESLSLKESELTSDYTKVKITGW